MKTLKIIQLTVFYPSLKLGSSGWQDSNLRPPRPKRGAITGLRYTPRWLSIIDYYHFQYFKTTKISSPVPGGVYLEQSREATPRDGYLNN